MRPLLPLLLLPLALLAGCQPDASQPSPPPVPSLAPLPTPQLAYEQFELANGLKVVVHEDRKAPIVAVSVWYQVGSRDEERGKTGFAHLFEHLMFNGSEHHDGEYFTPLEAVGATELNGTTWFDRTNYFQNVPTPALELALFLESDRMGHLLGAVTQEKLDNQREVVKNEKRQGDSQPFGTADYRILAGLFPEGHPYRWSTIGSMADLDAASLDDVKDWFKRFYGPNNAVVVLAGDIDVSTAKALMEKYFGDIPAGPPVARLKSAVPERSSPTFDQMQDRVAHSRIYRVWAVPGRAEQSRYQLELVASVLGGDKSARLPQALVYNQPLASSVRVQIEPHELASQFQIIVDLKPGVEPAKAEAVLDGELARLLADGLSAAELQRAQTQITAGLIRGMEQVGGFGGKATLLAEGLLYGGRADHWQLALGWMQQADSSSLLSLAQRWLGRGFYQLTVTPYGEPQTTASTLDRSQLPQVSTTPDLSFPQVERTTLANGLAVIFARRDAVPVVNLALQFDAGYAADSAAQAGLAKLTLNMLDEGTANYSSKALAETLADLGASLATGSTLDTSVVQLSALTTRLQPALALLTEVVQQPAFSEADLQREQALQLAAIKREWNQPMAIAMHTLPPLLYGGDHPYGKGLTGSGTLSSVSALKRADLLAFQQQWLRPDNATLLVVGDTDLATLKPLLEASLGQWQPPAAAKGQKALHEVSLPARGQVVVVDQPGSPQALILAGHLAPATGVADNLAIQTMNDLLGGLFTARINMNLREDKGWSYGAYTFLVDAQGQRPWMVYAPVQADKTAASIVALQGEIDSYLNERPASEPELTQVVNYQSRSLPGAFESTDAVLGALMDNARFGRSDDYVATLTARYRALTVAEINSAAQATLKPVALTWVVVGDKAQILPQLAAIGMTEVQVMSAKP